MTDPDAELAESRSEGCVCDQSFHDALDMLGFRHFWCVTCDREICGGSPTNHKVLGHEVRRLVDEG